VEPSNDRSAIKVMIAIVCVSTIWSAINPVDYPTWFFELLMGGILVIALVCTRSRFSFSGLVYYVVAVHFVILAAGAKYTYAEMPLFDWIRDTFELSRNHFDRVGHFAQGFTPALITREILIRTTGIPRGPKLVILCVSVAVCFSALYEIFEWIWVILFYPGKGPEWLGMQGDPWDAQADMFMALCGSLLSSVGFAKLHDRSMARSTNQS